MNGTFIRLETLRVLRNPRTVVLTILMPAGLFLILRYALGDGDVRGVTFAEYVMVNMAAYGAIGSALFSASNIALERKLGWHRQLRLTPLPPSVYVLGKGVVAWFMTVVSLAVVYVTGFAAGVRLPWSSWLAVFGATMLAVAPVIVLGVGVGLIGRVDAVQPIMTALVLGLALLGGLLLPVEAMPEALIQIAELTPSYWLGAAGRTALGLHDFTVKGVVVLAVWTALFGAFAVNRYRAADGRR